MRPLRLVLTAALLAAAMTMPVATGFAATVATGSTATASTATGSTATGSTATKPLVAGSRYLALGDSVAFGYRESANLPTPDYTDPTDFRGYPEELASALGLRLTNAACPGETSASFIDPTADSNGCENHWDAAAGANVAGGYRTLYPLHTTYGRSQLHVAKRFLTNHPGTRLVTLTLGANDSLLCRTRTSDGCVSEFTAVLDTLRANLQRIFKAIRSGAGYDGRLVVVDYYSLDYSQAFLTGAVSAINDTIAEAAAPYHVKIASGFDAFERAAVQANGDTCVAQLVTALTSGGCGGHPSVAGAVLLAHAVAARLNR